MKSDWQGSGRLIVLTGLGLAGVGVILALVMYFWPMPQMGADEEVFRSVDALFTAVTARDAKLLSQCEQQLRAQQESGKLPTGAAAYLDSVIRQARNGGWQSAAARLYDFIQAQRREGGGPATPKQPARRRKG